MGKRYRHTFPFWKLKTILKSRDGDVHEVDGWEDATWCVWSCVYDDHICLSLLCSFVIVCYVFFFILFLYCWKLNFWFFFIHSCIVAKYICDFSSFILVLSQIVFVIFLHFVLVLLEIIFAFFFILFLYCCKLHLYFFFILFLYCWEKRVSGSSFRLSPALPLLLILF